MSEMTEEQNEKKRDQRTTIEAEVERDDASKYVLAVGIFITFLLGMWILTVALAGLQIAFMYYAGRTGKPVTFQVLGEFLSGKGPDVRPLDFYLAWGLASIVALILVFIIVMLMSSFFYLIMVL